MKGRGKEVKEAWLVSDGGVWPYCDVAGQALASSPGWFFANITARRVKNMAWYWLYMGVSVAIVNSTVKHAVKQL